DDRVPESGDDVGILCSVLRCGHVRVGQTSSRVDERCQSSDVWIVQVRGTGWFCGGHNVDASRSQSRQGVRNLDELDLGGVTTRFVDRFADVDPQLSLRLRNSEGCVLDVGDRADVAVGAYPKVAGA